MMKGMGLTMMKGMGLKMMKGMGLKMMKGAGLKMMKGMGLGLGTQAEVLGVATANPDSQGHLGLGTWA